MRSKVPNDIHIMLEQSKIHASRIVIIQMAKSIVID